MRVAFVFPSAHGTLPRVTNPPLAFAVLAGLTPPDIEVSVFDERTESLPGRLDADLVAISANTFVVRHAYEIADRERANGVPVVLGGYHPSFEPEEALEHADSVVVGQGEYCWRELIDDFRQGKLLPKYGSLSVGTFDIRNTRYRYDVFDDQRYEIVGAIEFSRGCKGACEFCSVSSFNHRRFATQDPDVVLDMIAQTSNEDVMFVDDNLYNRRNTMMRLLRGMVPLKKRWFSQISLDVARDDEALELIKESGCQFLSIGFESLNVENLELMRKRFNIAIADYPSAVRSIRRHGIAIQGFFMVGYDYDTPEVFEQISDFAKTNGLARTEIHPVVPLPGTHLLDRYRQEGRIIGGRPWLDPGFRYGQTYHVPKSMSVEDLRKGIAEYSPHV